MTNLPSDPRGERDAPRYKVWQYALALSLAPVILLILLEAGLRATDYGDNLALFIPATGNFPDHLMTNPAVSLRYFTKQDRPPAPYREQFLRHKPKNGYRIFMIGESTATGWPYGENMMPSRLIARRLADAFPDRHIEVVNVGITAVNSYTFADFADEILAQSPDAVLIYGGHNEFYGALGVGSSKSLGNQRWLVKTYLALQHFKSFLLLRDSLNLLQTWIATPRAGNADTRTLMLRMVNDKNILHDGPVYQQAMTQFEGNMRDLLDKFTDAGVPVILSELVSNLRDQPPFVSTTVAGQPSALDIYQQARQLEQEAGRYDEARASYIRAKDLDALPFRAPEQINQIIHRLAREFRLPVVPMQRHFEAASPHGIIGATLMTEHLHPNAEGYFLLSEAFFDTLHQARLISAQWPPQALTRDYRKQWGITEFDNILARLRIIHLTDSWPFKPMEVSGQTFRYYQPRSALESLALAVFTGRVSLVNAHRQLAMNYQQSGDIDGALREYRAMIEIQPYELDAYRYAAWLALSNERLDDALPILLRAISIQPVAEASKWIGQIYLRRDNLNQAIHYLEQARAWDKENDPQIRALLREIYGRTGEYQKIRGLEDTPPASSIPARASQR